MTLQVQYRDIQDWNRWPSCVSTLDKVPTGASVVSFYREKRSHRGIGDRMSIIKLSAKQVDQDFLIEIGNLINLEYLDIEVITANDLSPLSQLENLRTLKLDSVRKATIFDVLLELPRIEKLFIQNAKNIKSLEFLHEAHQLISLGVEGSMWTKQKIASLSPLAGLRRLEALFLTSVQLKDKFLRYLIDVPRLKVLECARFAPKSEFEELRRLMPELDCHWCDNYEV